MSMRVGLVLGSILGGLFFLGVYFWEGTYLFFFILGWGQGHGRFYPLL